MAGAPFPRARALDDASAYIGAVGDLPTSESCGAGSPCRSRAQASQVEICAWIVTSSAVVGSSAISSFGRAASAIAIITRCLRPPESWCG
jgi:hypothetical protein